MTINYSIKALANKNTTGVFAIQIPQHFTYFLSMLNRGRSDLNFANCKFNRRCLNTNTFSPNTRETDCPNEDSEHKVGLKSACCMFFHLVWHGCYRNRGNRGIIHLLQSNSLSILRL